MKAYGYIRVSTEGQADHGVSLGDQRDRIIAWCERNNYDLERVFVDAGLSGGRADNRPALQDALTVVCRERATLVVYDLSRLTRSTSDSLTIADRIERAGGELVSLTHRHDRSTPMGKLTFTVDAAFNEALRDMIRQRTRDALAHKRKAGEAYGETPYGFRRVGDRLVPDAEAIRAVLMIQDLRASGLSYRAIAAELEARGIPTAKGKRQWRPATVQRIAKRAEAHPGQLARAMETLEGAA